jgi:hypothetical protein
MEKTEARELLRSHLDPWRTCSFGELSQRINKTFRFETAGPSGTHYQGSIQVFWDDRPNGDIRVVGSIDDGRWRAFVPLTGSFTIARAGSLVGEWPCRAPSNTPLQPASGAGAFE